jgi:hypothetical protein
MSRLTFDPDSILATRGYSTEILQVRHSFVDVIRGKICITLSHGEHGMPQEFGSGVERRPGHHQPGSVVVPQGVEAGPLPPVGQSFAEPQ